MNKELNAVKQSLDETNTQMFSLYIRTGVDAELHKRELAGKMDALKVQLDAIQVNTTPKPTDPKIARAEEQAKSLQAVAAVYKSLGETVNNTAKSVALGKAGRTQEAAAAGLRASASFIGMFAPLVSMAGPHGKAAGAVLQLVQGLCDMIASILDQFAPPLPKEKPLAEQLQDAINRALGAQTANTVFGAILNFDGMGASLRRTRDSKGPDGQYRKFQTWKECREHAEIIGGGGEALAIHSTQAWLLDRGNLDLCKDSEDVWLRVFALYVQAARKYLEIYQDALLLLMPHLPDPAKPGEVYRNPELDTALGALEVFLLAERRFIERVTPYASNKAAFAHVRNQETGGGLWYNQSGGPGFDSNAAHGKSLGLVSDPVGTVMAGREGLAWIMYENGTECIALSPAHAYRIKFGPGDLAEHFCVVPRAYKAGEGDTRRVDEIHVLWRKRTPARRPDFWVWDEGSAADNKDARFIDAAQDLAPSYKKDEAWPENVNFRRIAASPEGYLYLLETTNDLKYRLWIWDNLSLRKIHDIDLSGFEASGVTMSASTSKLYLCGGKGIQYKSHADVVKPEVPWTSIPRPDKTDPPMKMSKDWWYTSSVAASEGNAIYVSIRENGSQGPTILYRYMNKFWERQDIGVRSGSIAGLPLEAHAAFQALSETVIELEETVKKYNSMK